MSIEGLSVIKEPLRQSAASRGALQPPDDWDGKQFVGKWVPDGAKVSAARQSEILPGGYAAAGWEIWKEAATGMACTRISNGKQFVFVYRKRALQDAVNRIYANQSRERVNREVAGNSADEALRQEGLIPNEILKKVPGLNEDGDPTGLPMNPISEYSGADARL